MKYVQPECREDWIRQYKTEYTPKKESRLDNVFEVEDPSGAYLINFEPMGYYDVALPVRMLRYRSYVVYRILTVKEFLIWLTVFIRGKGDRARLVPLLPEMECP